MSQHHRATCDLEDCSDWVSLRTSDMTIPENNAWRSVKLDLGKGMYNKGDTCCYKHAVLFALHSLEDFVSSGVNSYHLDDYKAALQDNNPFEQLRSLIEEYVEVL